MKNFKLRIISKRKNIWSYNYKGTPPTTVVLEEPQDTPTGNKVKIFLGGKKDRELELREVEVMGVEA